MNWGVFFDKLGITPGEWRQGKLLITQRTKEWSQEDKIRMNYEEKCRVFSNFCEHDEGRSRRRVAICENTNDARFIAASKQMFMALFEAAMQFDFYAQEHAKKGKYEKYTTNTEYLIKCFSPLESATGKIWEQLKEIAKECKG